ncbi:hypothetical protein OF83DRAFT_1098621 [Amylostereum chailletii]|nr:hypothetical protein OF83DRAFT_1098621 [Amylostereum chailletii]
MSLTSFSRSHNAPEQILHCRINWWPTLRTLRETKRRRVGFMEDTWEIEESWKMLGSKMGLEENAERERYKHEAKYQCAWKECAYHKTKSPNPMSACKGCAEVCYCSRECQRR